MVCTSPRTILCMPTIRSNYLFIIPRPLSWGIPPHPNLSFSLAQRKEVKETSTPSKSSPIWEDYRIIANSLLSRCFGKAGRRLIFFLWLRPGFCAKISRNAIINKNIASSRDTKTLRKIDSAIFRFSPRLRRGDTGRGGAPLRKLMEQREES